MKKIKAIKSSRLILCLLATVFLVVGCMAINPISTAKASGEIETEILKIEEEGDCVVLHLTASDYMTASEWDSNTVEGYKWNDITYDTRTEGNAYNALLDKNLEDYNYLDNIYVDGVKLANIPHTLQANKLQRVNGLGISFNSSNFLASATEIEIMAGCQIPSLIHSYFGVDDYSVITVKEDTLFRKKNGLWTLSYRFSGYEAGVEYDASEVYFYKRPVGGNYKGHQEAPTCEFSEFLQGSGDDGFSLVTSADTLKGNLMVIEFVNPIDTSLHKLINLKFHVFETRNMTTYNANYVTESSLGVRVETVTTTVGMSTITLKAPLYADEDGMVDTLVFEFTNDGHKEYSHNQVALASFSVSNEEAQSIVYDKSVMIFDEGDYYDITFRFNKVGELKTTEVDYTKVRVNGISLKEINQSGEFVTATWAEISGFYQINICLSKDYDGEGQLSFPDLEFSCNRITVVGGLKFPNGEVLEETFTYNSYRTYTDRLIFENEIFIEREYENVSNYTSTKAESVSMYQDPNSKNFYFYIKFDKRITQSAYFHACEIEEWREKTLTVFKGMYDKDLSKAYVGGGYKSSLMENLLINGKSLGDLHATNDHQTCVFANVGLPSVYYIDLNINVGTAIHSELEPLFKAGEGVTITIKKGFRFTTGVVTMRDFVFTMVDGVFVLQGEEKDVNVYFDGKKVEDGDLLEVDFKALESSVYVSDVNDYTVTKTEDGDTCKFTVTYDGESISFSVKQNLSQSSNEQNNTEKPSKGGCGGSILVVLAVCMALAIAGIAGIVWRKNNEKS